MSVRGSRTPSSARSRRPRDGGIGQRLDAPALGLQQAAFGGHDVEVVRQAALVAQLRDLDFPAADLDAGLRREHAAHQPIALAHRPLHIVGDLALERRRSRARRRSRSISGRLVVDLLRRAVDRHGDGEERRELEAVEAEAVARSVSAVSRRVSAKFTSTCGSSWLREKRTWFVGIGAGGDAALEIEPVGERDRRRRGDVDRLGVRPRNRPLDRRTARRRSRPIRNIS